MAYPVTFEVDYVEPTGADLYVNGHAGGQEVVARAVRTAKVMPGDRLPIRWALDQALVFDAESGRMIATCDSVAVRASLETGKSVPLTAGLREKAKQYLVTPNAPLDEAMG